ncbi:hypothetical protein ACRRTK_018938 [Alexandromys fortis]
MCAFLGWMMRSHPRPPEIALTPLPGIPHFVHLSICHLIRLSPWDDSACVKAVAPGCMGSAADSSRALRQARSVPSEGKGASLPC